MYNAEAEADLIQEVQSVSPADHQNLLIRWIAGRSDFRWIVDWVVGTQAGLIVRRRRAGRSLVRRTGEATSETVETHGQGVWDLAIWISGPGDESIGRQSDGNASRGARN